MSTRQDEVRSKSFNQLWDNYQREWIRSAELMLQNERLKATIRLREKEFDLVNEKLMEMQAWKERRG